MGSSVSKYHEEMSSREIHNVLNGESNKPKKDKFVQSVKKSFEQRSQIGIKKYNTSLEREDLSLLDWLQHAQEEAMDLTLYLEKIKSIVKEKGLDKIL